MNTIPGVNMDEGLRRTGNHLPLYLRFLRRFPEDTTFMRLRDALDTGRMDDAFVCVHTLKGLTAQLGIISLYTPLSLLCETLRDRDPAALPIARRQTLALEPVYEDIVRCIRELP